VHEYPELRSKKGSYTPTRGTVSAAIGQISLRLELKDASLCSRDGGLLCIGIPKGVRFRWSVDLFPAFDCENNGPVRADVILR